LQLFKESVGGKPRIRGVTADIRRRDGKKFKEETLKRVVAEGLSAAEVKRRLNTGIGIVAHLVKMYYQPHGPARLPEDEPGKLKGEIARLRKEVVKGPSDSLDPLTPSSRLVHLSAAVICSAVPTT
jgi:hypothetical protein